MKKGKKIENEPGENLKAGFSSTSLDTDQEIHNYLNKRAEENLALQKILDNLNATISKFDTKSSKNEAKNI